jgi:hypothetical protein
MVYESSQNTSPPEFSGTSYGEKQESTETM